MTEKFSEEKKLVELANKFNDELLEKMNGRPYLLVIASGFEIGKKEDKSLFTSQWTWRSNVFIGKEESKKLMEFLISQLKDAVEDQENGIKKKYGFK
jgi:hypothetical protein